MSGWEFGTRGVQHLNYSLDYQVFGEGSGGGVRHGVLCFSWSLFWIADHANGFLVGSPSG
jgi:hypothetical protein